MSKENEKSGAPFAPTANAPPPNDGAYGFSPFDQRPPPPTYEDSVRLWALTQQHQQMQQQHQQLQQLHYGQVYGAAPPPDYYATQLGYHGQPPPAGMAYYGQPLVPPSLQQQHHQLQLQQQQQHLQQQQQQQQMQYYYQYAAAPPQGQQHVLHLAKGAEVRTTNTGAVSIPPPPPGCAATPAQMAAMQGQQVLVKTQKNSFF